MKLRFIAATLAVMAMGTTSIMAEGLQGTPSTPIAIVDSQKDSASILPEQYKSYATQMNTVVKDYKNGIRLGMVCQSRACLMKNT